MRTIIPAITIVVLLCLGIQTLINGWRIERAIEERCPLVAAYYATRPSPATQPATQPSIEIEVAPDEASISIVRVP